MSQSPNHQPGQSSEWIEQQVIEALATARHPGRHVKDILPGFSTDERNYVWIVLLDPTGEPFENTLTTVDTNDIRAWQEQHTAGLPDPGVA